DDPAPTGGRAEARRDGRVTLRTAWALLRVDPHAYALAWLQWVAFHTFPIPLGLLLKAVLDRIGSDAGTTSVWVVLAALAGAELARWTLFGSAVWQFAGAWIGWHTVPRLNLLRSLVSAPGPVAGRLPGSSGEAVSRFRDDTESLAQVLDVGLDISGAVLSTVLAIAILASIDARTTFVIVLPVVAALGFARWLGPRIRAWRVASREAAAEVTSYLGDLFGSILAVKASGAEAAAASRFRDLNDRRRVAARRDQAGTALVESLGGVTGEVGVGLMLLLIAPALRRGELSLGDVGLFASYVTVLASLPRWVGRLGAYIRQGGVSVERLAALTVDGDPAGVVAPPVAMDLRHGPGPAPTLRARPAPPATLSVRGLTADHGPGTSGIIDVDLDVRPGQLVVLTGPVGSGKTSLLRATLGLLGRRSGTIAWGGEVIDDPGAFLVPPRVAYVPQVPRLFSEPLVDTILLGLPVEELDEALELAQLTDDVAAMPNGLATVVGPRGVRLSGGQVQRAATARALARRPALLVVDDLSSALDVATEVRLWDGLLGRGAGRTALVVTHRRQVLDRADVVVELRDGRRVR
ncbi:MAG: ABC transporter ATP-binding protein, partial [Acidimicrobiia bacterium]|nr:ABC transporter ATP-binding protein [Acidimicrobiia bacterium]